MKDGEHQIRVIVEIRGDGYSSSISGEWRRMPASFTLESAAKFSLQNCLDSKALKEWATNPHEPSYTPDHD